MVRWSVSIATLALVAACGLATELGPDDSRRLSLDIRPPTRPATVSETTALSLANEIVGFSVTGATRVHTFLVDVSSVGSGPTASLGDRTVWVVRYSGSVPVGVPAPLNADGTYGEEPRATYGYVLVDAITGEVFEISYTGN